MILLCVNKLKLELPNQECDRCTIDLGALGRLHMKRKGFKGCFPLRELNACRGKPYELLQDITVP